MRFAILEKEPFSTRSSNALSSQEPSSSGVRVFGCATGLGKDETCGETASEGTAVDTGDAASNAATDIL